MARTFVICELDTPTLQGRPIGAVHNAHDRNVSLSLTGLSTASFQIGLNNPMANEITDRLGDVLLKVYRGSTLEFIGDCISAEEVGADGQTLACTFSSPLWRLSKRLVAKDMAGASWLDYVQNIYSTLLGLANGEGNTGLQFGAGGTLPPISGGPWTFKPLAEVFTELAALQVMPLEVPGTWTVRDSFTTVGASGDIAGRALEAPTPQTWGSIGSAGDFQVGFGTVWSYRSTVDAVGDGRYAIAGTDTVTNVMVEMIFHHQSNDGNRSGVVARWSGSGWVVAWWDISSSGSTLLVSKKIGATWTILGSYAVGEIPTSQTSTLRMRIDDTGDWWVWSQPTTGLLAQPLLSGRDTDLATGGPLASGQVGMYDEGHPPAPNVTSREYDSFQAVVPAVAMVPVSVAFEVVPIEPTGTPVKIATLNVAERIGTDRPNVIFEYGGGNRAIKSYKRVISRDGLLTRGYTLPQDIATSPVTTSLDQSAIDARGLYEEVVPTDIVDASLRQAVGDLHVFFRKQARQIVTFDPFSATAPVFGTDYFVGDTITARAIVNGTVRFNGLFRVYGVEISIDDEGKETVTPTLTAE